MDRPRIVAALLTFQGWLLVVVAAIHLSATPLLRQFVATQLNAEQLRVVWPPLALSFVVMGILLIPVGLSTVYCARGIRKRESWAWAIAMMNALAVMTLPVVLAMIMERSYFQAVPFLVASILITLVGLSMVWPLLWIRGEISR